MVGAGVQVRLDAVRDLVGVSPRHEVVHDPVGELTDQLGLVVTEPDQASPVVLEAQHPGREVARELASSPGVGLEHDSLVRREQRLRPKQASSVRCMSDRDEVWVRSTRPLASERQSLLEQALSLLQPRPVSAPPVTAPVF